MNALSQTFERGPYRTALLRPESPPPNEPPPWQGLVAAVLAAALVGKNFAGPGAAGTGRAWTNAQATLSGFRIEPDKTFLRRTLHAIGPAPYGEEFTLSIGGRTLGFPLNNPNITSYAFDGADWNLSQPLELRLAVYPYEAISYRERPHREALCREMVRSLHGEVERGPLRRRFPARLRFDELRPDGTCLFHLEDR